MGTVNLGQVAAFIDSVEVEKLPADAEPAVRNDGTRQNAKFVFGVPALSQEDIAKIDAETTRAETAESDLQTQINALKTADSSLTNRVSTLETANNKTQTVSTESTMLTGRESSGLSISDVYDGVSQGYPTQYGNLITIGGQGGSQLLLGWSGETNGVANVYYRNRRDNQNTWSPWKQLAFA